MPIYNSTKFLTLPQQVNKNKKDIESLQEEVEININNYIPKNEKGQPLGVATLDENGKFLSSQLPSYVDDVLEYANISDFPATGESGKIYVTLDTNKTYRWSGSGYIEISASLVLGETSSTAYRGDRGKTAYDHTFLNNNPHGVTKAQVGLGNVDNTSDLNKPISTATQTALNNYYTKNEVEVGFDSKVDKNNAITAGTKTKITYDAKGLVTGGADLEESDIPTLPASKITQDANNRFVTDNEKSTWNGKQNALTAGDGISISGNVISASGGGITVENWDMPTKTLALSDSNKLFRCSWSSDQTLTIPTDSTVPFPIGTMVTFLLVGTSTVLFAGESGVTLTSMDGLVELKTQYAMATLIKTGTNTWQLVGALE